MRYLGASFLIFFSAVSLASSKPLFLKGRETFRIFNDKFQTPVFHLLTSSPTKQAIATAVNSTYGLASGKDGSVEVRLEKLYLEPVKNKKNSLTMTLLVSGHEVELDTPLNRTDFESGKQIQLQLPSQSRDFEMLKLTSNGSFSLQYLKSQDFIRIDKASMKVDVESPLGDEDPEAIQFTGRALRQNP